MILFLPEMTARARTTTTALILLDKIPVEKHRAAEHTVYTILLFFIQARKYKNTNIIQMLMNNIYAKKVYNIYK